MSKCEFFSGEIESLGHLVSQKGIFTMNQKVKAITELTAVTNITEANGHNRLLQEILSYI